MDVHEAIRQRRSVRAYQDKAVADDVLRRVLEAARLAPSAKNRQEWRFIVVRDEKLRRELARAAHDQLFIAEAPVCLAFCATEDDCVMSCGHKAGPIDAAIAEAYVTLAAVAEGLGTCWIGAFSEEKVKQLLGVPANVKVVAMTPLGYPASPDLIGPIDEKRRKDEAEIFSKDKFPAGL